MPVSSTAATLFSIAMIGAFVLIGFGIRFALGTAHRKEGRLMVLAGIILFANVAVWLI